MKPILVICLSLIFINIFAQNKFNQIIPIENRTNFSININGNYPLGDSVVSHKYSVINLSGQLLVGSALAFIFTIPAITAAGYNAWSGHDSKESHTIIGVIGISSYLIGAATGVYWVAKSSNSELSYWGTVGYSAIGGSASAIIAAILASKYTTIPNIGALIIALCPVASSMIYASFISDWPQKNQSFSNKILTHKDLINCTNLFNIDLIHINL